MRFLILLSVLCVSTLAVVVVGGPRRGFGSSSSSDSHEHGGRGGRGGRGPGRGNGGNGGNGGGGGGGNGGNGNNGGCESGWRRFTRPSGAWCIRVYNGALDQAGAQSQCSSNGATLSGIQNNEELTYMTGEFLRIQPSGGTMWVGAQKNSGSFQWTDDSTTGSSGFAWDVGMPDNLNGQQNCVILFASSAPSVTIWNWRYRANTLDDIECSGYAVTVLSTTAKKVTGYVCGKRPTRNG